MSFAIEAGPIHRHRWAQVFAFNRNSDLPPVQEIASPKWNLLVALAIASSMAGAWLMRSYRKRSDSRLSSKADCVCDTAKVPPEKGDAKLSPGKGGKQTLINHQSVKRSKLRERSVLAAIMLLLLCYVLWLWSRPISAALEVFQVYQPIHPKHNEGILCDEEVPLVDHVFGFSYGNPFVGHYEPPECEFDTVRINLTVTSRGRQFDRLAHMYLGDIEVFRTSTAEPTANGIIWTYIKDMSQYNVLWKERQKVIFDLGNLVNEIYTGSFNVRVTARFSKEQNVKTPSMVLPISAQNSARNSSSAFMIPAQEAKVTHTLDPRTSRAVVSISACGQSTEEFWWSNVFSSDTDAFDAAVGELYGYSPFREIQLYIDGTLAGVVWPFPVIFTGGVSPGFWRPVVGIDTFDLRSPEIDVSPFLPLITDGASHSFEIKVVGLEVSDSGEAMISNTVGSYWVVSGNIFLYLDHGADAQFPRNAMFGQAPEVIASAPTLTTTRNLIQNQTGFNESLVYSVRAERTLAIKSNEFVWSQNLSFSNVGLFNQQGLSQQTQQQTSGTALSGRLGDDSSLNELKFEYPLRVNTTYGHPNDGLTIDAWLQRGLHISTGTGIPGISTYTLVSGPVHLRTRQWGQSSYRSNAGTRNSTSFGATGDYFESNADGAFYQRSIRAVNGSVVSDSDHFFLVEALKAL
ncbi:peptide N-acetyl-beta-D-glucosaminyl asparaginase amidase A-domain-containing protein [Aspergillus insuetus]